MIRWFRSRNRNNKHKDDEEYIAINDTMAHTLSPANQSAVGSSPGQTTETRTDTLYDSSLTEDEETLPRALVFVDYEHWVYGLRNLFGLTPDPLAWRNELAEMYELVRISVFANFGDAMMADHLSQIRQITNSIFETRTSNNRAPKDMTDFIMLDNIYQSLDEFDDVDTYIFFTGDGHFQSVARYLKQRRNKRVIIYGIKGSLSRALTTIADDYIELPLDGQVLRQLTTHILENLEHFDLNRKPDQYATFRKTAEVVSRHYELDEQQVLATLSWLVDKGYIDRVMVYPRDGVEVRALQVHWKKVEEDNLWKPREL